MREEYMILEKEVDISVLRDGMAIPAIYQNLFMEKIGIRLHRGESTEITIQLQDRRYRAMLRNLGIKDSLHPGHGDLLQIRYARNSELATDLRKIFSASWTYIQQERNARMQQLSPQEKTSRIRLTIPDDKKEYIVVYTTPNHGSLVFDCITNAEFVHEKKIITHTDELYYEWLIMQNDTNAGIELSDATHKVRRMTRAIGESLKFVYDYRCQICGAKIGEQYGSQLIHAHHIDYFTHSLNNNPENIMIVCPNHHGIIHDRNPQFNKQEKTFTYPNGLVEGLKVNLHL